MIISNASIAMARINDALFKARLASVIIKKVQAVVTSTIDGKRYRGAKVVHWWKEVVLCEQKKTLFSINPQQHGSNKHHKHNQQLLPAHLFFSLGGSKNEKKITRECGGHFLYLPLNYRVHYMSSFCCETVNIAIAMVLPIEPRVCTT